MSQLTTHILDTTIGKPAPNVAVVLYQQHGSDWNEIAAGHTNADGRIPNLLPSNLLLALGHYKLLFKTEAYFQQMGLATFYPYVEIVFNIQSNSHYHVPLLLNPFGYSTYRGS